MANMADITLSLSGSNSGEMLSEISTWNELQSEQNQETLDVLREMKDVMELVYYEIAEMFETLVKGMEFTKLRNTDKPDITKTAPIDPGGDDDGGFSLADFFKTLATTLTKFVTIILPAILAALGLSNLGLTGLEFKALESVKAFFTKEWWSNKATQIKNLIKNNKAVVAIKEFFGKAGQYIDDALKPIRSIFSKEWWSNKPTQLKDAIRNNKAVVAIKEFFGKAGQYLDDVLKPIKAFFSLEGDGILAKVFQGLKGFGGAFTKVLGKVFLPISLLMSAFDGFLVASKASEETNGNIVSTIIGFIGGFVASFFGTLVDLIKSGISWIIEKIFGENNPVSEFLDSFSVADILVDLSLSLSRLVDEMWEGIKSMVPSWDDVTSFFSGDDDEATKAIRSKRDDFSAKQEEKRLAYVEEMNQKSAAMDAAKGNTVVNAPNSSTTNVSNSNSTLNMGSTPNASNASNRRKRQRGGG